MGENTVIPYKMTTESTCAMFHIFFKIGPEYEQLLSAVTRYYLLESLHKEHKTLARGEARIFQHIDESKRTALKVQCAPHLSSIVTLALNQLNELAPETLVQINIQFGQESVYAQVEQLIQQTWRLTPAAFKPRVFRAGGNGPAHPGLPPALFFATPKFRTIKNRPPGHRKNVRFSTPPAQPASEVTSLGKRATTDTTSQDLPTRQQKAFVFADMRAELAGIKPGFGN